MSHHHETTQQHETTLNTTCKAQLPKDNWLLSHSGQPPVPYTSLSLYPDRNYSGVHGDGTVMLFSYVPEEQER